MTQFTVGNYKTKAGLSATVACLKQVQGEWVLKGAIHYPETNVSITCAWLLNVQRLGSLPDDRALDLTRDDRKVMT